MNLRSRRVLLKSSCLLMVLTLFFVNSALADTIGLDDYIDFARIIILPEDGLGDIPAADAVQFNTGFTLTASFGYVACYIRTLIEVFK